MQQQTISPAAPPREEYISFRPLVEPVEDGVVPLDAVVRFEHPVVVVGEVQQLAGDALVLAGCEGAEALRLDDAVVHAPWTTSIGVFQWPTNSTGLFCR